MKKLIIQDLPPFVLSGRHRMIQYLIQPPSHEWRGCNEAIMQLAKPDPVVPTNKGWALWTGTTGTESPYHNHESGYFGVALQNTITGERVIVNRGTEFTSINDLITTSEGVRS